MPKIRTYMEFAAHLTQAYMDSTEKKPDPDVQFIQEMSQNLTRDIGAMDRPPMTAQSLQMRYKRLDAQLKDAANYIKTGNVDPKVLYEKQSSIRNTLAAIYQDHEMIQEAIDDKVHPDHEKYSTLLGKYDHKHFSEIEATNGANVLKMSGETKSAAKWIESVYKEMEEPVNVNEDRIALILAARQLGNAVYGDPRNIKKAKISESELRVQAEKIKASEEFQEYYKTVQDLDFKKTIKHGHGGYLEKTFEDFLQKQEIKEPLEFDSNNRYHVAKISQYYDYKNYKDYFERNKGNVAASKLVHAARMAAADALGREKPDAPFDKKALDAKAKSFMKQPSFNLMMAMPGKMDMLVKGDAPGFAVSVKNMNDCCQSMLGEDGTFKHLGQSSLSLDRLQQSVKENPDLGPVVDSVNKLKEGKKTPNDVINTLNTIMDYQEKHINDGAGAKGKNLNDSLRLLHELTKGTEMNGVVQTQIDKVNQARSRMGSDRVLTQEFIGQEGRDAEAKEAAAKNLAAANEEKKEQGPVAQPGSH